MVVFDGLGIVNSMESATVLDVTGTSTAPGAALEQWHLIANQRNQRFGLDRPADGYYRIITMHSGKVLDVSKQRRFGRAID
jgi:hypothetical protein